MSEDAQTRRDNLASLQLGPKALTEKLGRTYSFWRDLTKSDKSFGEKLARSIEEGLDLPRGWLDRPRGDRVVLDYRPVAREQHRDDAPTPQAAIPVAIRAIATLPPILLGQAVALITSLDDHPEDLDKVITKVIELVASGARRKQAA